GVRRYAFDDLPIIGATIEGEKIHVLQGRTPHEFRVILHTAMDAGGTNRGVLRHVVLDAARLPELAVIGTATAETDEGFLQDAKPLWPMAGTLVWYVTENWPYYWWRTPVLRGVPLVQPLIGISAPVPTILRPIEPFNIGAPPKKL